EANLEREDKSGSYETCPAEGCDDGQIINTSEPGGNVWIDCTQCNGDGEVQGDGINFDDEDECQQYIEEAMGDEATKAFDYIKFYDDGSVDSEVTATIALDKVEHVLTMIEAFKKLADANGNGMDVDGAGMHVSVLTTSVYPTRRMLPNEKIENFRTEVTKLLPALFVT